VKSLGGQQVPRSGGLGTREEMRRGLLGGTWVPLFSPTCAADGVRSPLGSGGGLLEAVVTSGDETPRRRFSSSRARLKLAECSVATPVASEPLPV
jgi:hypothetical protein